MMQIDTVLADHGVSPEDIDKAKSYQTRAGGSLEKILLNMGSFSEELLPSVYSQLLEAPLLTQEQRDSWQPPQQVADLPLQFLLKHDWLVFACPQDEPVQLLTFSPLNWDVLQYLTHEKIDYRLIITSEA
ncbi:type II secretion system protein GspE, partial [bacterium]|nr:type II secretion system protein GspE [bacterium]